MRLGEGGATAALALVLAFAAGAGGGVALGAARVAAIDAGALRARAGAALRVEGHLAAVPRRSDGRVRLPVETAAGSLLVDAPEPVADLAVGTELRVEGRVARPRPWERARLRAQGIAVVLRAAGPILPTGERRGGIAGHVDLLRRRAEEALGRGMPAREAALARGFVLGQDDRIDPRTVEDFRRSGLAHLLAVSGQNVVLLCLLATPLLAALAVPLRARLLWLLALIAVYVPLAGAGPSIQRAGVMGAAGVLAMLAGRPRSRAWILLLAAAATLALNPHAAADPGWQLSFAAVLGIFAWAGAAAAVVRALVGTGAWARAFADGAGVTIAATLATAPLVAHHFGALPVATLAANLLTLPAVAPAMWLGMAVAAAGQLPGVPVEPLNAAAALPLAYIAQVAAWCGRPAWALAPLDLGTSWGFAGACAATVALVELLRRSGARRRRLGPRRRLVALAPGAVALAAAALAAPVAGERGHAAAPPLVTFLDVGQGDAILLRPPRSPPLLVDAGGPAAGVAAQLRGRGVERLGALLVTHGDADHAGGAAAVLESLRVGRLLHAGAPPELLAAAAASGARTAALARGDTLRAGGLALDVLWPPPEAGGDANSRSLVLLVRWRGTRILLTGDAEAEAVPLDAGPVDVLKVAHHGSADAGLAQLLARARPAVAVVSAGAGNPFGHPDPATLRTLRAAGAAVLRTDRHGEIELRTGAGGTLRALPSG